ncbi:GDSL/SGNH-like acyl-esterase family protein [Nitzschia inconspicua]|uniref:GDSL/SGNH-like acyl-esterase family protein n=1 Tax=Nitzschia inconspicua TaxID=303405 RepID=A0A9K3KDG7_9STRA|nr:GDSL/SGNH-like acyl-esterase family protein [Nitzschia inconspicua]
MTQQATTSNPDMARSPTHGGSNTAHAYYRPKIFFMIIIMLSIVSNTRVIRHLSLHSNSKTLQYYRLMARGNKSGSMYSNEYATVSVNEKTKRSSTPVFASSADLPLCSRDDIRVGSWQPVTLKSPPYVPRTVHLRCYPEDVYQQGFWNTYDWQPSSTDCSFASWDPDQFCRLLYRATILVIGDSLSWEHYRSLNHLLGNRGVHQSDQHQSKKFQGNVVYYVCPQHQTRLVFRRDDLLTNVSQAIFNEGTFPHVIVMNRGAHYKNDTVLLTDLREIIREIQAWQEECSLRSIKCHFFWRTSVPGHPQCNHSATSFSAPVNDIEKMEAMIADLSLYNNRTLEYHWFDYQHQNLLVEELLQHELLPPKPDTIISNENVLQILDAYYLNVLRPDEHRAHQGDCLHNCYPGKMDVYSRMLFHYLLQQRSQKDIGDLIAWQDKLFGNETRRHRSK